MKIIPDADGFEKLADFSMRLAGSCFLIGLVVGLVLTWVLTGTFCELGKWMTGGDSSKKSNKN